MAHQIEDVEIEEEEEYDENADEDFNPEAAKDNGDVSSSSEDEEQQQAAVKTQTKGKGRSQKRKPEAVDELDSGDEATIQERKKKKRRKDPQQQQQQNENDYEGEESGGEGGLIKTRAQRLAEKTERKQRKRTMQGEATIDVEQVWADLSSLPIGRLAIHTRPMLSEDGEKMDVDVDVDGGEDKENAPSHSQHPSSSTGDKEEEMITIKRRIEYAGETIEISERVPRSSKEAQEYLTDHPDADPNNNSHKNNTSNATSTPTLLRPLKRASLFEPNPLATVKNVPPDRLRPRAPSRLDVLMAEKRAEEERARKAEKMTTVQKSALDWRGFVDEQTGLREELEGYGKSKAGFLAREEFLGRVELGRERRGREARMRG